MSKNITTSQNSFFDYNPRLIDSCHKLPTNSKFNVSKCL